MIWYVVTLAAGAYGGHFVTWRYFVKVLRDNGIEW